MKEGGRGGDDHTLLAELLNGGLDEFNAPLEVVLPDVAAVDHTDRQNLLRAEVVNDLLQLLGVADEVGVEGVGLGESAVDDVEVVHDITEVSGEDKLRAVATLQSSEFLVCGLERTADLGGQVEDQDRLIDLHGLRTSLLELLQELLIHRDKLVEEADGVDGLVAVGLAKVEEGDRAEDDRTGDDASLLGLKEVPYGLRVTAELEGLVVLQCRLDVVVVAVKPLDHLQTGHVNAVLLMTTAHGKVLVQGVEAMLAVPLWNGVEHLDVVENLVVVGEVIAGNDIHASIFLNLPVLETQPLALGKELIL